MKIMARLPCRSGRRSKGTYANFDLFGKPAKRRHLQIVCAPNGITPRSATRSISTGRMGCDIAYADDERILNAYQSAGIAAHRITAIVEPATDAPAEVEADRTRTETQTTINADYPDTVLDGTGAIDASSNTLATLTQFDTYLSERLNAASVLAMGVETKSRRLPPCVFSMPCPLDWCSLFRDAAASRLAACGDQSIKRGSLRFRIRTGYETLTGATAGIYDRQRALLVSNGDPRVTAKRTMRACHCDADG